MRVLVVDNFDSFTWNLAQLVASVLGEWPTVVTNDAPLASLLETRWDRVLLSPGPGSPYVAADLGVCKALLERLTDTPILGVCLGQQAMAVACGARVTRARRPVHGHVASVRHDGSGLFAGLSSPLAATRYHSLVVDERSLPPELRACAWSDDGELMAIAHTGRPWHGVQFHPESIATPLGEALIARFLDVAAAEPRREIPYPGMVSAADGGGRGHHRSRVLDRWIEPDRAFAALAGDAPAAFWLDGGPTGGRSLLGVGGAVARVRGRTLQIVDGEQVETREGEPFALLEALLAEAAAPPGPSSFSSGWVGCLGYELGGGRATGADDLAAPRGTVSALAAEDVPDALLMRARRVVVCDPATRTVTLVAHVAAGETGDDADAWLAETGKQLDNAPPLDALPIAIGPPPLLRPDRDDHRYRDDIARALEHLGAGESYELCLTRQLRGEADVDALAIYRVLREVNPAPFAALLRFPEVSLLSSSPERFVSLDDKGLVESRPIKGTRRRGTTPGEDARLVNELSQSPKDRAENLMIVDLVRNDLNRVCTIGSVAVPSLMAVEVHPSVLHLVSTVRGRLRAGVGPLGCVRALFPGGSMTGAPKVRSMRILDALEGCRRGLYSGALGWLSSTGALDLAMTIRTIVLRANGELSIGVGGAIVADSDPEAELDELRAKSAALETALARAGVR